MDYRIIPKTGLELSTIGIGSGKIYEADERQTVEIIDYAIEQGINVIDMAMSYRTPMQNYRTALRGRREKMHLQMQLGMNYSSGEYVRDYSLEGIKQSLHCQLETLGTDYADIALFHCVDSVQDFETILSNGAFAYAVDLKKAGVIRNLGFGSHTVDICNRFLELDEMDVFMFSVNAAYDLDPTGSDPYATAQKRNGLEISSERQQLYQNSVKKKVAIQVMKAYGAGKLLDAAASPFGRAMTIPQCLQYALDRPAVTSCMLGIGTKEQLEEAVQFYAAPPEARDYSFIAGLEHKALTGSCVYCNHCMPCPAGIDIGRTHKFLDLYLAGDDMAREHYAALEHTASECLQCGVCESRCPFAVSVREKMQKAQEVFGR